MKIYPTHTIGVDGKLRHHSDNPFSLLSGDANLAKYLFFNWTGGVQIGTRNVSIFNINLADRLAEADVSLWFCIFGKGR